MTKYAKTLFQNGESLLHPRETVASFVGKMTAGITPRAFTPDRRETPRYTLSTIIDVQPLDEKLQPAGDVFQAVARDISVSGIGLTHNRAIDSELLAVQLTNAEGDRLQTVMRVLRNRPYDSTWDIGGQFVTSD